MLIIAKKCLFYQYAVTSGSEQLTTGTFGRRGEINHCLPETQH